MKKQLATWQLIKRSLQQNIAVILLYVLASEGSSPGRQGFFMAVNANGEMQGSIGGGIMEHKFVEMARGKLSNNDPEISIHHQIHDKIAASNQSGMICSGEQRNFMYRLKPGDLQTIESVVETIEKGKNATLQITHDGIFFESGVPEEDFFFQIIDEDGWRYEEKVGYKHYLYLIGGGHCALALSKIMRMLDFYIRLYDDRESLKTFMENNYVHEKTIINHYSELNNIVPSGKSSYVVIMTVGYRSDDIVLRSLLNKHLKYVGLLGSQKKIDKMFNDYKEEGIDPNKLNKIYSPIGLQIHSQTPEEIAISIAAEIINVKNNEDGH